jgi:hypothetical protein
MAYAGSGAPTPARTEAGEHDGPAHRRLDGHDLGPSGRTAASETAAPNVSANLVWSGCAAVQRGDATRALARAMKASARPGATANPLTRTSLRASL